MIRWRAKCVSFDCPLSFKMIPLDKWNDQVAGNQLAAIVGVVQNALTANTDGERVLKLREIMRIMGRFDLID